MSILRSFVNFPQFFLENNFSEKLAAGTMIARYGTDRKCGSLCEWEITNFSRGNGFENSDGVIIINQSGIFSITAQLHNHSRTAGNWIRTNIHIRRNGDRYFTIVSQRFKLVFKKHKKLTALFSEGQFSATANLKYFFRKGDQIKISSGGDHNSYNGKCNKNPCENFNYLEVLFLTFEPNEPNI